MISAAQTWEILYVGKLPKRPRRAFNQELYEIYFFYHRILYLYSQLLFFHFFKLDCEIIKMLRYLDLWLLLFIVVHLLFVKWASFYLYREIKYDPQAKVSH